MKPRRIENREILDEIKRQACLGCGAPESDPSHVTSVGAGGGDTEENVMPLCRRCHSQWHSQGVYTFSIRHPKVIDWFFKHNRISFLVSAYERRRGMKI
jgi:5-methylcytosine-specific restriction endonuclease McrA